MAGRSSKRSHRDQDAPPKQTEDTDKSPHVDADTDDDKPLKSKRRKSKATPSSTKNQTAPIALTKKGKPAAPPVVLGIKRKAYKGRQINFWDPGTDQLLLLALQYECDQREIKLPWVAAANHVLSGKTESSILQHLNKLRRARLFMGHRVPPQLSGMKHDRQRKFKTREKTATELSHLIYHPPDTILKREWAQEDVARAEKVATVMANEHAIGNTGFQPWDVPVSPRINRLRLPDNMDAMSDDSESGSSDDDSEDNSDEHESEEEAEDPVFEPVSSKTKGGAAKLNVKHSAAASGKPASLKAREATSSAISSPTPAPRKTQSKKDSDEALKPVSTAIRKRGRPRKTRALSTATEDAQASQLRQDFNRSSFVVNNPAFIDDPTAYDRERQAAITTQEFLKNNQVNMSFGASTVPNTPFTPMNNQFAGFSFNSGSTVPNTPYGSFSQDSMQHNAMSCPPLNAVPYQTAFSGIPLPHQRNMPSVNPSNNAVPTFNGAPFYNAATSYNPATLYNPVPSHSREPSHSRALSQNTANADASHNAGNGNGAFQRQFQLQLEQQITRNNQQQALQQQALQQQGTWNPQPKQEQGGLVAPEAQSQNSYAFNNVHSNMPDAFTNTQQSSNSYETPATIDDTKFDLDQGESEMDSLNTAGSVDRFNYDAITGPNGENFESLLNHDIVALANQLPIDPNFNGFQPDMPGVDLSNFDIAEHNMDKAGRWMDVDKEE